MRLAPHPKSSFLSEGTPSAPFDAFPLYRDLDEGKLRGGDSEVVMSNKTESLPGVAILMLDIAKTTLGHALQATDLKEAQSAVRQALGDIERVLEHAREASSTPNA